jgi:translocator protein
MGTWLALGAFLAASFAAAGLGVLSMGDTAAFYSELTKPSWAPPAWLFGPVWTVLYIMIAVAGWMLWRQGGWSPALSAWTVQLVLNAAWTPAFFGLRNFTAGLVVIALLLAAIIVTIVLAWREIPVAGVLLLPYLLWVSFAAALNAALWSANPQYR